MRLDGNAAVQRLLAAQDPAGILEGSGRVHRHIKMRVAADLDRPEVRDLMLTAVRRSGR